MIIEKGIEWEYHPVRHIRDLLADDEILISGSELDAIHAVKVLGTAHAYYMKMRWAADKEQITPYTDYVIKIK